MAGDDAPTPAPTMSSLPQSLKLKDNPVENYQLFKQRWQAYTILSNFTTQSNNIQKALLIHCLGDDALKVYNSFTIADSTTVEEIFGFFDNYIVGATNDTYERFKFNKRSQNEEETFDSFYADLQRLIKTCNYCDTCNDSLLKDRIVLGIRDSQTQKDLLKTSDLNLKKCVDICKASEKATLQNKELKNDVTVNKLKPSNIDKNYKGKREYELKECRYCGNKHVFSRNKCPAYGKKCSKCGYKNHFAALCHAMPKSTNRNKKSVHNINNDPDLNSSSDDDNNAHWICQIDPEIAQSTVNNIDRQIFCRMTVNGKENVKFQIDTGSSINVIPVKYVTEKDEVVKCSSTLKTWNNSTYEPIGECRKIIKNPKTKEKYNVKFIVCNDSLIPILGLNASKSMNLIEIRQENFEKVNSVYESEIFHEDNLGCLKGKVHLEVKPDAKPVVMPNKKIPLALKPVLKTELDRLEKKGVIRKIDEPTEWVNQYVFARKKNGEHRLCLDPRPLNANLNRERYALPVLDDILHDLGEAKVFSRADLKNGYWHCSLDDESSKLTSFMTPFGRYCWLRLPFGLSVSSEIFGKNFCKPSLVSKV